MELLKRNKFSVFYFFLLEDEFQSLLRSLSTLLFINVIILVPSAMGLKMSLTT